MHLKYPSTPFLLCFLCFFLLTHCTESPQEDPAVYTASIEAWQETRNEEMRDTSSWLSLVILHWLEEGESTFGSDSSNTILFPEKAPALAGTLILEDSVVTLQVAEGVDIRQAGKQVQEIVLNHDMDEETTFLQMGSFNFYIIKRPEGYALRVKDSQNPELLAFDDIPNFEIDPDWKLEARLDWHETPKSIQIPTVLGSERTQQCPAIMVFEVDGESYELSPYMSFYGDPVWTLIFSDLTNGETTYGGGRFVDIIAPEVGTEYITLDFNKAYNPPCAFSEFATCPLPPPENRLPVAIPAGEEMYGEMH